DPQPGARSIPRRACSAPERRAARPRGTRGGPRNTRPGAGPLQPGPPRAPPRRTVRGPLKLRIGSELLELDAPASLLEVGLELVGLLLLDALLDGLGGLVDERLGLLEAAAGR